MVRWEIIKDKNNRWKKLCVDREKVGFIKSVMKEDDVISRTAQTFKVLGDPTRTKILFSLSKKELCVCDLSLILNISQSATSHQLRVLRNMNLVKYRKDGRMTYYSLDDNHVKRILKESLDHVEVH